MWEERGSVACVASSSSFRVGIMSIRFTDGRPGEPFDGLGRYLKVGSQEESIESSAILPTYLMWLDLWRYLTTSQHVDAHKVR